MTIHVNATYRNGVIHPDQPLALPEGAELRVMVVPVVPGPAQGDTLSIRPESPKITPEEFDAILDKYSVSVGSLPVDFSREDIYQDHD
jgi:predicted DNA-binding antitoxin AbrB/MazE fold protein